MNSHFEYLKEQDEIALRTINNLDEVAALTQKKQSDNRCEPLFVPMGYDDYWHDNEIRQHRESFEEHTQRVARMLKHQR